MKLSIHASAALHPASTAPSHQQATPIESGCMWLLAQQIFHRAAYHTDEHDRNDHNDDAHDLGELKDRRIAKDILAVDVVIRR